MPVSHSQKLRRAAKKTARRQVVVAEKRKADIATLAGDESRQIMEAARAPITTCLVGGTIFQEGIGWVILARTLPSGTVGASFFLVDAWCLGIKDAFFRMLPHKQFEENLARNDSGQALRDAEPPYALRLLQAAAAYASSFGLAPSEGYAKAAMIFGDIAPSADNFVFGQNGKPMFVSGPNDSPSRIRRIMAALADSTGDGGYEYVVGVDGMD